MGKFIEQLQKTFADLFSFTNVLLQEGKDLESLKNFLLSHIIMINRENVNLHSQIEDLKEKLASQNNMKSFLANKNKDQEVRIHEFEAAVIKNNEKIKEFNEILKLSSDKEKSYAAEKTENDTKIKLLSKEIKQSRKKVQELETNLKFNFDTMVDMKILFENLRLDI